MALHLIDGQAKAPEELEREALRALRDVLEEHVAHLPVSSPWRSAFVRMRRACLDSLEERPLGLTR